VSKKLEDGTYKLTADTGSLRYMAPEGEDSLWVCLLSHSLYLTVGCFSCPGQDLQRNGGHILLFHLVLAII